MGVTLQNSSSSASDLHLMSLICCWHIHLCHVQPLLKILVSKLQPPFHSQIHAGSLPCAILGWCAARLAVTLMHRVWSHMRVQLLQAHTQGQLLDLVKSATTLPSACQVASAMDQTCLWCIERPLVMQIRWLRQHFNVHAVDMRGHGHSHQAPQSPLPKEPCPSADIVSLLAALQLSKPLVLAHSLGATMAAVTEVRRPGTWAAMFLFESNLPGFPDEVST
jgi:Alpha/beta hydrolase family